MTLAAIQQLLGQDPHAPMHSTPHKYQGGLLRLSYAAALNVCCTPSHTKHASRWLLLQVCKVYIGSFNADKPIRTDMNPSGEELFNKEQSDLLQDLFEIPQRSCDRKVTPAMLATAMQSSYACSLQLAADYVQACRHQIVALHACLHVKLQVCMKIDCMLDLFFNAFSCCVFHPFPMCQATHRVALALSSCL